MQPPQIHELTIYWRIKSAKPLQSDDDKRIFYFQSQEICQSEKRKGSSGCIHKRTCDMIQLKYNYMKCATKN